jgi:DNA-binding MarR family transcriptional regulator
MSFKSTVQRRLANRVKDALRDASLQLALLNHQVGARLKLRDVDFDCLNLLNQHGPLGPGALAKLAGLHPATMTGVLDRLERAGWATRDRDREDRRAVVVRAAPERGREIFELYAGMNGSMDDICADYTVEQLEIIEEFLRRTAAAGHDSTVKLTD